jgi:hypothetical protein
MNLFELHSHINYIYHNFIFTVDRDGLLSQPIIFSEELILFQYFKRKIREDLNYILRILKEKIKHEKIIIKKYTEYFIIEIYCKYKNKVSYFDIIPLELNIEIFKILSLDDIIKYGYFLFNNHDILSTFILMKIKQYIRIKLPIDLIISYRNLNLEALVGKLPNFDDLITGIIYLVLRVNKDSRDTIIRTFFPEFEAVISLKERVFKHINDMLNL